MHKVKKASTMNFDEALVQIGEFGKYQKRLYFLLCLMGMHSSIYMQISVFLLGVPKHRCALPGWNYDTYAVQSQRHLRYLNRTIPPSLEKDLTYDPCHIYQSGVTYDDDNRPINDSTIRCSRWVYDDETFKSTFTSEQNLVCEDSFMPALAKMWFFGGVLIGSFGFGIMSDKIGRKKTLCISLIILITCSVMLSWANTFVTYVTLRFISGAVNAGIFIPGYVLGMELVGPSKRMWAGCVVNFFTPIGLLILTAVAYIIRDWKYIELTVSLPMLLYLSYYWIIPESPRWLMSQGRLYEAEAILHHAAKVNKATLPEQIFDRNISEQKASTGKLWNLFSSKVMAKRTLIILFNWLVVSMVYYGLSLNTGNLGGSFYWNYLLSVLVEFPALTLLMILLDRLGRKKLHCACMVAGGLACVTTGFSTALGGDDFHALTVTLAMIGKLGATAAFGVMYIFSAELYPTVLRNAGIGTSSSCARIGGILAPYIAGWTNIVPGDLGKDLPLVIFGITSVVAGILALGLPETLGRQMPETIEEAENFGKDRKTTSRQVHVNRSYTGDDSEDDGHLYPADKVEAVPLI